MRTAIVWSVLLVASADLFGQSPAAPAEAAYERKLFSLQHVYAPTLAQTISKAFNDGQGPSLTAVPDAGSNSLLISAPAQTLKDVGQMIAQLDRKAPVVAIDVWIIDLQPDSTKRGAVDGTKRGDAGSAKPTDAAAKPAELLKSGPKKVVLEKLSQLEKEGRVAVVSHLNLKTMDNQSAFTQQGERKPKVVATTSTSKSGRTTSSTYDNVGTKMQVQPRAIAENLIVMYLDIEKSRSAAGPKSVVVTQPEDGPVTREVQTPITIDLLVQTTVSVPNGEILSLSGLTNSPGGAPNYQVLVSGEVVPEGAK